jgi:hypothetical protein
MNRHRYPYPAPVAPIPARKALRMLPVAVSTQHMEWDKARKTLVAEASALGIPPGPFPRRLRVQSHYTGRSVLWVYDAEAAERNEGWDGELAEYTPIDGTLNAQRLVVLNT